ncbi:MAG: Adventurous gliding motility protein [Mycobacterium sp.]|nr:Adventurous gliding motility protein [Mycobacterium sp.]
MLERKLAKLQEDKRKDLVAAGEAWGRISRLLSDDDQAILTASRLFEKGERPDLAATILAEGAPSIEDPVARGQLMQRLAELREQLGDVKAAGDSYAEAADALRQPAQVRPVHRLLSRSGHARDLDHRGDPPGPVVGGPRQPHRQRRLDQDLGPVPPALIQYRRNLHPAGSPPGQRAERPGLVRDQARRQRVGTDLREAERLTGHAQHLQHRLAVGPRRSDVEGEDHGAAEHRAEVVLDRAAVGRVHRQPSAEHPGTGPGPEQGRQHRRACPRAGRAVLRGPAYRRRGGPAGRGGHQELRRPRGRDQHIAPVAGGTASRSDVHRRGRRPQHRDEAAQVRGRRGVPRPAGHRTAGTQDTAGAVARRARSFRHSSPTAMNDSASGIPIAGYTSM